VRGSERRLGDLLKSSVIGTVSTSFAVFGLTAIQGIILARLIGPQGRGEWGTATFYTQTLTYIGLMGAQFVVARRAARDPASRQQLSRSVIRFGMLSGLVTIGAVAVLAFTLLPAEKTSLAPLCVVCALALPLEQTRLLLLAVDQGSGNFRRYNVVQLITSLVLPCLLLVMWINGQTSVTSLVLLTLVAPVVGLSLRWVLGDERRMHPAPAAPSVPTLLKEGSPYLLSSAVGDIYGRLDSFLILWLASFSAQGLYAAAVPAAGLLMVAPDALALFSFNATSRQGEAMSVQRLLHGSLLVILFQTVTAVVFALAIAPLITIVYGNSFAGAVPFALALIPANALGGLAKVADGHLRGRGKIKIGVQARLVASAVMVVTTFVTFSWLRELSIPVAASFSHGILSLILGWCVLVDVRSHRDAPSFIEAERGDR
jgi:O-antigen/teichoic acid export membrane protein